MLYSVLTQAVLGILRVKTAVIRCIVHWHLAAHEMSDMICGGVKNRDRNVKCAWHIQKDEIHFGEKKLNQNCRTFRDTMHVCVHEILTHKFLKLKIGYEATASHSSALKLLVSTFLSLTCNFEHSAGPWE